MRREEGVDWICFSHLRWNFVYQRPQHLMSRMCKGHRVFFIEEPLFGDGLYYDIQQQSDTLWVVVPHFSREMNEDSIHGHLREFISRLLVNMNAKYYACWYYTPMALLFSDHLTPVVTVYDSMDELSGFKFAPQALKDLEKKLLGRADVVFTGGHSLYDAKKTQHDNIYAFPSSIDFDHFSKARSLNEDPEDQALIPHPRFGFYGVIDERMNIRMIKEVAVRKRDWHFVLIGPVVKISENSLPRFDNIHYLGMKSYQQLPSYLAGWDVAIMPFALNEATRFISPTKTPEYLAGGKPVISTPILDVMRQYCTVVNFAATSDDFILVAENDIEADEMWLRKVDNILSENSWDKTWTKMYEIIQQAIAKAEKIHSPQNHQEYV
jgi:glycosyltransferase involved in cell wall biosynthesis